MSIEQNYKSQLLLSPFSSLLQKISTKSIYQPSCYISYAWPIGQDEDNDPYHEAWSKDFIQNLAKDLAYVGFQVFLDDFQSGAGFDLGRFMRLIQ